MQIHEITLTEATPRMPVRTGLAQRAQARNTPVAPAQQQAPARPQATPDEIELARRRQRAAEVPGAGPTTQAIGNWIANKIGPRGLPSQKAGAPAQQPVAPQAPVSQQPVQQAQPAPQPTPIVQTTTPTAPAKTYPPITIGNPKDPKATVYVNKGKGYVDSKSGQPIPPAILKAMGS